MFIPVNRPLISESDIKSVTECLKQGWVSGEGPFVQRFEEEFARRIGKKFAVAVSNGTIALEMALSAINCTPDHEVIIPTFSIISLVQAVLRVGAKPILVDSNPDDWNMNIEQVIAKTTPRTKAVIAMHTYGLCTDIKVLSEHCKQHGIALIEDAAEALGATCYDQPCGRAGDISTFSFYANKLITTGEGGALCTDDDELYAKLQSLRNLCFSQERRFLHNELGYNGRLSAIQAALGLSQLSSWDRSLSLKAAVADIYNKNIKQDGVQLCLKQNSAGSNVYWVYGLVLDPKYKVENGVMIKQLEQQSVGSRPFFWCVHQQPVLTRLKLFAGETYPIAEKIARFGLYLPSGVGTTIEEAKKSADVFNHVWDQLRS